jgi:hypothetical protein
MVQQMLQVLEASLTKSVCKQTVPLTQGVRSKVYQPLLQRNTCCKYFDIFGIPIFGFLFISMFVKSL